MREISNEEMTDKKHIKERYFEAENDSEESRDHASEETGQLVPSRSLVSNSTGRDRWTAVV